MAEVKTFYRNVWSKTEVICDDCENVVERRTIFSQTVLKDYVAADMHRIDDLCMGCWNAKTSVPD